LNDAVLVLILLSGAVGTVGFGGALLEGFLDPDGRRPPILGVVFLGVILSTIAVIYPLTSWVWRAFH
jgi:hypothetical protein